MDDTKIIFEKDTISKVLLTQLFASATIFLLPLIEVHTNPSTVQHRVPNLISISYYIEVYRVTNLFVPSGAKICKSPVTLWELASVHLYGIQKKKVERERERERRHKLKIQHE